MELLVGSPNTWLVGSNKTDLARSWQQKLQKEVVKPVVKPDGLSLSLVAFFMTIGICLCVKPPLVTKDAQYKTTFNYPLIVLLACAVAAVVYFIDDSVIDAAVALSSP